jgi:hypothetical protein
MIGTTRSRVSVFLSKFKRQGLITYDRHGHMSVRKPALGGLVGTIVFHRKSCLCKFEQVNARLCVTFMNGRPKSGSLAVHRLPSV